MGAHNLFISCDEVQKERRAASFDDASAWARSASPEGYASTQNKRWGWIITDPFSGLSTPPAGSSGSRSATSPKLKAGRIDRGSEDRGKAVGFVILTEGPGDEPVIGVAGRFWRPDGGRCMGLAAEDFAGFSRSRYAKAAWNFKLRADSPEGTFLSTETRIKCFGLAALWKFRIYWSLVGPFSGLIRKAILKHVKAKAESTLLSGDHSGTR